MSGRQPRAGVLTDRRSTQQALGALRDTGAPLRAFTPGPPVLEVCLEDRHPMTVKMRDIAKDLGVSVITVSKVLRNHPDIGHDTRERVLARVKELDYRPNLAARSLVTGRTYL